MVKKYFNNLPLQLANNPQYDIIKAPHDFIQKTSEKEVENRIRISTNSFGGDVNCNLNLTENCRLPALFDANNMLRDDKNTYYKSKHDQQQHNTLDQTEIIQAQQNQIEILTGMVRTLQTELKNLSLKLEAKEFTDTKLDSTGTWTNPTTAVSYNKNEVDLNCVSHSWIITSLLY